ncbi:polyhydroxyalkanoic acid system family protein [Croceibacterium ferulae]|uniref:polyhydroxyalkanoic acid system family protein n=1 Tax=Croceibacterium ferulae TaxID=1854641 RepID=UPI000EB4E9C6|nr:polyhydroxyalkanoic acid system family protein [Croceibacterium ferulae]
MQVAIPHTLGRDTARERLRSRSHTLADAMPGGAAEVKTDWPTPDRMHMTITAMGQVVDGNVDIDDTQLLFSVTLPPMLSFLEPMIAGAIRQQGPKLLK